MCAEERLSAWNCFISPGWSQYNVSFTCPDAKASFHLSIFPSFFLPSWLAIGQTQKEGGGGGALFFFGRRNPSPKKLAKVERLWGGACLCHQTSQSQPNLISSSSFGESAWELEGRGLRGGGGGGGGGGVETDSRICLCLRRWGRGGR